MKKNNTIKIAAIIVGIVIAIPLIIFGFLMLSGVITRAGSVAPQDVVVNGLTATSARINWTSGDETEGTVIYGTSPNELRLVYPEIGKTTVHAVTLTLLKPGTTYYFKIRVGDEVFDNDGIPWRFSTKSSTAVTPTQAPVVTEIVISPVQITPGLETALTPGQVLPTQPAGSQTGDLPTPIPPQASCPVTTDCNQIRQLMGKGCSSSDYIKCIKAQ